MSHPDWPFSKTVIFLSFVLLQIQVMSSCSGQKTTQSPSPSTYVLSGVISGGSGATVALSGASSGTTTADASGNYSFSGLANGSYTVTPSKAGMTFSPASQTVTISGANVTGVAFSGTAQTFSISGTVSGGSGATVALSGASSATITADASGNYSFSGLANGSYTVTPSKAGFTINPSSKSVTVSGANVAGVSFTATAQTYVLSGTLSPLAGGAGATLTLSGAASATTTSDASGSYSFAGLGNGSYAVTPSNAGYAFTPTSQSVNISGGNVTGVNFTASPSLPTFSISGTVSPAATGAGTLITLSGAANSTTTADSSGNYILSGLSNGSYTITPSGQSATFSPTSLTVTINNANVTGENFTATSQLDSAWTALNRPGDGSNSESENYQTSNVAITGGNLVITEQQGSNVATGQYFQNDAPSGSYTSCASDGNNTYTCTSQYSSGAVVWRAFNIQYGDLQVRMKMPFGWPAIWMLGTNCQTSFVTTPDNTGACNWDSQGSGEIDIAEGDSLNVGAGSLHANIYESGVIGPACTFSGVSDPTQNYHIYEINWTSSGITWYVDGSIQCSSNSQVPDHMFLIINAAIGGILGGNPTGYSYPNTGYVDWVKVCSSTCSNGTTGAAASNGVFWDDFGGASTLGAAFPLQPSELPATQVDVPRVEPQAPVNAGHKKPQSKNSGQL